MLSPLQEINHCRHQHFARIADFTGGQHRATDEAPHLGVIGIGFENFASCIQGSLGLTVRQVGSHQEYLELGVLRRSFDTKCQEFEYHRRSAGVQECTANRQKEITLRRILIKDVTIKSLSLVELAGIEQHLAESFVDLERSSRLAAPKQEIGEPQGRYMV